MKITRLFLPVIIVLAIVLNGCTGAGTGAGAPPLKFRKSEITLMDGAEYTLKLDYFNVPKDLSYSVEGDSVTITDLGTDGVRLTPVKDGVSTVRVSGGNDVGECVVNVIMPRDIIELMESGDVSVIVSCGNIQEGQVTVRNDTDHTIVCRISPGTFMAASGSGYQNMMIMEPLCKDVRAGTSRTFTVSTCCMNIHRSVPTEGDGFSLSVTENEALMALAEYFHENTDTVYAIRQAATWIITDGATYGDCGILVNSMGSRVISQYDYDAAKEIVDKLMPGAAGGKPSDAAETAAPESHEEENSLVRYDICGDVYDGSYYLMIPKDYYTVEKNKETGEMTLIRDEDGFMMGQSAFSTPDGLDEMMGIFGASSEILPDKCDMSMTLAGHEAMRYVFYNADDKEYIAMYLINTEGEYAAWMFIAYGSTVDSVAGDMITGVLDTLGNG